MEYIRISIGKINLNEIIGFAGPGSGQTGLFEPACMFGTHTVRLRLLYFVAGQIIHASK